VCRGVYPWEGGSSSNTTFSAPTAEELLTQLRNETCRVARCEEELQVMRGEQAQCIAYFRLQLDAIQAAIVHTKQRQAALEQGGEVPPCTSVFAVQPASPAAAIEERSYCTGLLLLLGDRQCAIAQQLETACSAFGNGIVSGVPADKYESDDEGLAM